MANNKILPNADIEYLIDVVQHGGINYSFNNYGENEIVDFDYILKRFDPESVTELTDKIKDLVTDWLYERINEQE